MKKTMRNTTWQGRGKDKIKRNLWLRKMEWINKKQEIEN